MAKKQVKGYKGKTSAKVIAVGATAGVISLAIVGGNIIARLNQRPQVDNPYDDTYVSDTTTSPEHGANTDNLVTEPPIEMDTSYETGLETETLLPELQETMIPDPTPSNPVEDMGVEFVEVLAKLTNMSKEYINSVHGNTPNLTIMGLNSINVNAGKYEVQLLGQVKVNNTYNYFVASVTNANSALNIYNLSTDSVSETDLVNALDEVLSDKKTTFALGLNQHVTLSNSSEIIDEMLASRLEDLNTLDQNDASIKAEKTHLNKAISNSDKLELSIVLNDPIKTEKGYHFSFSLAVNTGKYLYVLEDAILSKRLLNPTALKHSIEDHLDNLAELNVLAIPSTPINEALYVINDTTFNLENEQSNNVEK